MDISSAIFDPELGCTGFTVERITYTRTRAGTTSRSTTAQAMGCIHPGTPTCMKLLLEGIAWSLFGFFGGGQSRPETAPADTAP